METGRRWGVQVSAGWKSPLLAVGSESHFHVGSSTSSQLTQDFGGKPWGPEFLALAMVSPLTT